ncbi:acyltransferase family protein [Nocardioides sp. dk4132]|uniref:acyltransferase family protein n=1 Tax=unclassified Nocardioides TaxID=2615069 RepID=UPI001296C966|nr:MULTISPECIES: acyltransferase family protein [unclassified Nocardioides]MQW75858.1 acyltransferase family protein [Nocardioides sp. dk4132]QGA08726.1 acyltransferase family protein [Nocardioides sp. dk884]
MTQPRPEAGARSPFRADVQGLRAIAVLTVIAGHAGLAQLPGGFVGVDVFFVISGFLITQLLLREVARTGRVSLRGFYARRARRILPAATLVTLVTLGASVWLLSALDALEVVKDAAWATIFAANIRFAAVGTDYFARDQLPSPLQHYWSLAVEEQFYLVWPLVLVACVLLARRLTRGAADPSPARTARVVMVTLGVLTAASFAYGVWRTEVDPAAAYFSTPARAWELGLGALAVPLAPVIAARMPSTARGLLSVTGLGFIAAACLRYDETSPFPGTAALLPVVGALLVLVAGAGGHPREPFPIRALGVRPMRVVGDWSYSLYLWHWPLLVLPVGYLGRDLTPLEVGAAVAATFLLSGLTYRLVETPFRRTRVLRVHRGLVLYPVSLGLVAAGAFAAQDYAEWRTGEHGDDPAVTVSDLGQEAAELDPTVALVKASVLAAREGQAVPSDLTPDLLDIREDRAGLGRCSYETDSLPLCPRGTTGTPEQTVVVLGNSHGRMWVPAFERIAREHDLRTYYLVKVGCPAALVTVGSQAEYAGCTTFREWALEQIAELDPDLVVVATNVSETLLHEGRPVEDPAERDVLVRAGFDTLFDRLAPIAGRTVLLRDVPELDESPEVCLSTGRPDLGDCLLAPTPDATRMADLSVASAQERRIPVIDPTPWVCWDGSCPAVIGSTIPYRDVGHLTTEYAAALTEDLERALAPLLGAGRTSAG